MKKALIPAGMLLLAAGVFSPPALALEKVHDGVYRFDPANPDELLELEKTPDARVLIVDETKPKLISEVHSKTLHNWVQNGGILWVVGDAVESSLVKMTDPDIKSEPFEFHKPSTGKKGGELVVRDASDKLKIADHPLTKGVDKIYVYPARRFDQTHNLQPIIEMADDQGHQGVVIGSVAVGKGMIVLDGSRHEEGFFNQAKGFTESHPHAVKSSEGVWNSYDWDKLLENARSLTPAPVHPATPTTSG
jgi:hypothetical protein